MIIRSPGTAAAYLKCIDCDREFKLEWPTWFWGLLSHRKILYCPFCASENISSQDPEQAGDRKEA